MFGTQTLNWIYIAWKFLIGNLKSAKMIILQPNMESFVHDHLPSAIHDEFAPFKSHSFILEM